MIQLVELFRLSPEGSQAPPYGPFLLQCFRMIRELRAGTASVLRLVFSEKDLSRDISPGDLLLLLHERPMAQLKHSLFIIYVPKMLDLFLPQDYLESLVTLFPEVGFRIVIEDQSHVSVARCLELLVFPASPEGFRKLHASIERHVIGCREWFDTYGVRRSIRHAIHLEKRPEYQDALEWGYVIEDEAEYRDALGYVAYRCGRYKVHAPRSVDGVRALFAELEQSTGHSGFILHALDIAFPGELASERDKWSTSEHWESVLGNHRLRRSCITGLANGGMYLESPKTDKVWGDGNVLHGWDGSKVRGKSKPLGWFHDILSSGLLGAGEDMMGVDNNLSHAFFDGEYVKERLYSTHSAVGQAQFFAEQLIQRASKAMVEEEPLLGAVMALDAARLLRGKSVTVFLDAISTLYAAEAKAEIRLAAAAGGGGRAVKSRAVEEFQIRKLLAKNRLAPPAILGDLEIRLWTHLRQIYLSADAFEAAEEALLELHRVHRKRGFWGIEVFRGTLEKIDSWLEGTYNGLQAQLARKHQLLMFGSWLLQKLSRLRVIVPWLLHLLLALALAVALGWRATRIDQVDRGTLSLWLVPCGVLFGLLWALLCRPDRLGWVGAALRIRTWFYVAVIALILVTSGNMALFRKPVISDTSSIKKVWIHSLAWTTRQLLNAEVPVEPLQIGEQMVSAKMSNSSFRPELAQAEGFNLAVDASRSMASMLQWFIGEIAGWALFAFGLSAIYRKATRG